MSELFLFGRHTYAIWLDSCPTVTDPATHRRSPQQSTQERRSHYLDEATGSGPTIIRDDIAAIVNTLKKQLNDDIVVSGSGQLVHALTAVGTGMRRAPVHEPLCYEHLCS